MERPTPRVFEKATRKDMVTFKQGDRVTVAGLSGECMIEFFVLIDDVVSAYVRPLDDEYITPPTRTPSEQHFGVRIKDVALDALSHVVQTPREGVMISHPLNSAIWDYK